MKAARTLIRKATAPLCLLSDAHQKSVEDAFHRGELPFVGFTVFVLKEKNKGMTEAIDFICAYSTFRLCMMRTLKDGGHKFAALFSQIAFMMKKIMEDREEGYMNLLSGPREPDEPISYGRVKQKEWPSINYSDH